MKLSILTTLTLCALFAATAGKADNSSMAGHPDRNSTEPGVIERWSDSALARMEHWISRARSKITGRKDDPMQDCNNMMGGMSMMQGGGMGMMQGDVEIMGNMNRAQPNDQWRNPAQQPQPDTPDRKP